MLDVHDQESPLSAGQIDNKESNRRRSNVTHGTNHERRIMQPWQPDPLLSPYLSKSMPAGHSREMTRPTPRPQGRALDSWSTIPGVAALFYFLSVPFSCDCSRWPLLCLDTSFHPHDAYW